MKRCKFKVGDKVTVVKCIYGHRFKLGSVLTINRIDDNIQPVYFATLGNTGYWVDDNELSPPPLKKLKVV